jgi:hypothetical protein
MYVLTGTRVIVRGITCLYRAIKAVNSGVPSDVVLRSVDCIRWRKSLTLKISQSQYLECSVSLRNLLEVWEKIGPSPTSSAKLSPRIIVHGARSMKEHSVDYRSSTYDSPTRHAVYRVVQRCLRRTQERKPQIRDGKVRARNHDTIFTLVERSIFDDKHGYCDSRLAFCIYIRQLGCSIYRWDSQSIDRLQSGLRFLLLR